MAHTKHNRHPQAAGRGAQARVLRIIGGAWRGRKLRFPAGVEIRPTPDRVRETLFNWLGPRIVGARCLDLFAGSGALGLEALSRGAAFVAFVEQDAAAVRELRARIDEWGLASLGGHLADGSAFAPSAHVERGDALRVLAQPVAPPGRSGPVGPSGPVGTSASVETSPPVGTGGPREPVRPSGPSGTSESSGPFDIVFLDPPFGAGLLPEAMGRLERNGWLRPGALIYVECAASQGLPEPPPGWRPLKSRQAGEVGYHLLVRAAE